MNHLRNSVRGNGFWRKSAVSLATAAYLGLALVPAAHASDTEVYAGSKGQAADMAPTLMMQLDSNKTVAVKERFTTLIGAMQKVLYGNTDLNVKAIPGFVRMGYTRYQPDGNNGGWIRYPARPLDALVDINPNGAVGSQPATSSDDVELKSGSIVLNGLHLDTPSNVMGIRFPNLLVPKQATIKNAYIEFTPSNSSTPDVWVVDAEDTDDAATFTSSEGLSSRTYIPAIKVENTDPWELDGKYRVDVTPLMQSVVDRAGWCGGNATVFRLDNGASLRAHTFDNNPDKAPRLVVEFSMTDTVKMQNSCIVTSVTSPMNIASGADDIELNSSNAVVTGSEFLNGVEGKVALRFVDKEARIFQGGTVTAATLYLTGYVPKNPGTINSISPMTVAAYDTANQPAFGGAHPDPSGASRINAVTWSPTSSTHNDVIQPAVSVKAAVQAIINKAGWAPGNAFGFDIRTAGTTTKPASFQSYELSPGKSAQLVVSVSQKITDLTKLRTVRDEIFEELSAMSPTTGATPLADAYQETMRYMLGLNASSIQSGADKRVLTLATQELSGTDRQYQSPLTDQNQCAANYVFMLASGEWGNSSNIGNNTDELTLNQPYSCTTSHWNGEGKMDPNTSGSDALGWACMLSTAKWGADSLKNQKRTIVRTSSVLFNDMKTVDGKIVLSPEAQIINNNLAHVTKEGGGTSFLAGDEAGLIKAITDTVNDLLTESGTITAPGVAVNQLNRLNNLDQLFYAVFQPTHRVNWQGNVKRYQLDIVDEKILDNSSPQIEAIDPVTSFFSEKARSWWLPTEDLADGRTVAAGGAARVLPDPSKRQMFAYTGSVPSSGGSMTTVSSTDADFVKYVQIANGLPTYEAAQNLINWYRGYVIPPAGDENAATKVLPDGLVDISAAPHRRHIGGVLHSRPTLVSYGYTGTATEAATNPDKQINKIFFSTLEGTLHAVDANTGIEEFTFIPGEKVANLKTLYEDRLRSAPNDLNPEFGMDLTWSVYRKANKVDPAGKPDAVYIYGGMRMGGGNYYALDVTDLTNPKLMFAIKGGAGGFADMGQTWSQPVVASIRHADVVKTVLVFAGGYDAAKYEVGGPTYPATGRGNKLFMVDALSGDLIWSSSDGQMSASIPSQPKTADVNGDGLIDHIYVGDLDGKVFRVDVDNSVGASSLVKRVKLFADVGGSDRRFYEPPTVALFKDASNKLFAAVGMGSGNRSHPLVESTNDRFYMFFDYDITRADILKDPSNLQDTIKESGMASVNIANPTGVDYSSSKGGWYIPLSSGDGEKVITSAVIFRNKLVFSTFLPTLENTDVCSPVRGSSNLYLIDLTEGGTPEAITLKEHIVRGLGADPQVIILPSQSDPTKSDAGIVTGTDVTLEGEGISAGLQRTRWYEKTKRKEAIPKP